MWKRGWRLDTYHEFWTAELFELLLRTTNLEYA